MATKEELYVSISPEIYKKNKSNILMNQADLLKTLKHLHNLTILARQKRDLKIRLHKLFEIVISEIDLVQDKIPTPRVPKAVSKKDEPEEKEKKSFSRRKDIEEELKLIQSKLIELNS